MISAHEATVMAQKYAKTSGYMSAELKHSDYLFAAVVPCYAFQLIAGVLDTKSIPENMGLPQVLFIDKISGELIESRALL